MAARPLYTPGFLARIAASESERLCLATEAADLADCSRCADSGIIAIRVSTGKYAGPGPLPNDARGYTEIDCPDCGNSADCPEAIAQWATFGEREDNWFSQIHDSDDAWAERNGGQRERE